MDETDVQNICRTCLKSFDTNKFQRYNLSDFCTSLKTYGQLLQDYGQFYFCGEQEDKLPQGLCATCVRLIKKFHTFINKAQTCNLKLLDIVGNNCNINNNNDENENYHKEDCLNEEAIIDLPAKTDGGDNEFNDQDEDHDLVFNDDDYTGEYNNNDNNESITNFESNESNATGEKTDVEDINESETEITNSDSEKKESESIPAYNSIHPSRRNSPSISPIATNEEKKSKAETCPICMKKFKQREYLLKHLRKIHHISKSGLFLKKILCPQNIKPIGKIIKCTLCDYKGNSYSSLAYHNRTKHPSEDDKYKCKFCSFSNTKRWALVGHIKNEHKIEFKTLKKTVEKQQHRVISGLEEETLMIEEDISKDITLDDSSDDEGFIRRMINEERRITKSKYTDGEPFHALARKCEECGKVYKNFLSLHAHQRFVHIPENMYSVCLHCGKKYKRRQDLKSHIIQSHTPAANNSELDGQSKRFMCTECPYATTTTTHLKIHIRRHHTGEKPYVCEICGYSFLTSNCLKTHKLLHTGEKPHKCPYCPKTFRVSAKLRRHKRIHTGERPYKCNECGKAFTQDYNLTVHKRMHNKNRNE